VLQLYGEHSVEAVLHRLTARECRREVKHPAITSTLLDEAEAGDRTAARIVRDHGRSLGDYAVAAATRIGLDQPDFSLVLTGGVFRHTGNELPGAIVDRVRETYPEVRSLVSRDEPVIGAVLLALEAAGILIDGAVMSRLRAGSPIAPANPVEDRLGAGGPAT
jgi:N-acetylglucosamine kinase-like BadF-type ATPase